MIIEKLNILRDKILQYQPYFHKGFADVQVVENAERQGVFLVNTMGEHQYAMEFDYNFFYIRRNGSMSVSGNSQDGFIIQPKFRLFASARNVDLYEFLKCMLSSIASFCNEYSITNIETEVEKTLLTEMKNREVVKAVLSRFITQPPVIIAIDFSLVEIFNTFDVTKCDCNPCNPCATL